MYCFCCLIASSSECDSSLINPCNWAETCHEFNTLESFLQCSIGTWSRYVPMDSLCRDSNVPSERDHVITSRRATILFQSHWPPCDETDQTSINTPIICPSTNRDAQWSCDYCFGTIRKCSLLYRKIRYDNIVVTWEALKSLSYIVLERSHHITRMIADTM